MCLIQKNLSAARTSTVFHESFTCAKDVGAVDEGGENFSPGVLTPDVSLQIREAPEGAAHRTTSNFWLTRNYESRMVPNHPPPNAAAF